MDVISRNAWGASSPSRGYIRVADGDRPGVEFHHTVGTYGIDADQPGSAGDIARAIQGDHLGRGWTDGFYNAVIDRAGDVAVLRPWTAQSGSVRHFTIAFAGNYDRQRLTDEQKRSAARLVADRRAAGVGDDVTWHAARDAVGCPGLDAIDWILAGMPVDEEDDVFVIRYGESGDRTRRVQTLVQLAGERAGEGDLLPRWGVDGHYGDETAAAINRMAERVGLPRDGEVGLDVLVLDYLRNWLSG